MGPNCSLNLFLDVFFLRRRAHLASREGKKGRELIFPPSLLLDTGNKRRKKKEDEDGEKGLFGAEVERRKGGEKRIKKVLQSACLPSGGETLALCLFLLLLIQVEESNWQMSRFLSSACRGRVKKRNIQKIFYVLSAI